MEILTKKTTEEVISAVLGRRFNHELDSATVLSVANIIEKNRDKLFNFEVINLVNKYRDEQLPNRDKPFHYEAEIDSGLKLFLEWLNTKH
jgi:hypothetical protein